MSEILKLKFFSLSYFNITETDLRYAKEGLLTDVNTFLTQYRKDNTINSTDVTENNSVQYNTTNETPNFKILLD